MSAECPRLAVPEDVELYGFRFRRSVKGDLDGVPDLLDNCLEVANPLQQDADGDGFGNEALTADPKLALYEVEVLAAVS